ncbi:MAG: DUF4153 domain-containing protein [Patescibacteria group bacterium]
MKRILDRINVRVITSQLQKSLVRFPITCIALSVLAISLLLEIHSSDIFSDSTLIRIVFSSLFAIWLSVGVQLGVETLGVKTGARTRALALTLIAIALYVLSFPADLADMAFEFYAIHIALHTMLGLALLSSPSWAEWYRGKYTDTHWYSFSFNTALYAIQALLIAIVLILLGALLLWTVESLFDPAWFASEFYLQWFVLAGVIGGPLYFLSMLPTEMKDDLVIGERFVHLLIRYIAVPFIYIYFVILYLYTFKVLINFSNWPQGEVAILVIYFSFFSYLVYLFSYHLENESWIAHTRRLIPILLVPQIAMLFYSIGLRIEEYGWTINRYLVVLLGLWLALMSLYHMYRYHHVPRLVIIPTTLVATILIAIIGPWSMYNVPEQSQLHRLEAMLIGVDILNEEGEMRGLSSAELEALSQEEMRDIISAIDYLCEYHGCNSLRAILPGEFLDAIVSEHDKLQSYLILEEMNLPSYIPMFPYEDRYLSIYTDNYLEYLDVSKYEHFYSFNAVRDVYDMRAAWYDIDTGEVVIEEIDSDTVHRIPIIETVLSLLEAKGEGLDSKRGNSSAEDLYFTVTYQGEPYFFTLSGISGERSGDKIKIDYLQGAVLY